MDKYRKLLDVKMGAGQYYRGEECQLSKFTLLQCSSCKTYFEYGHYFYSDPESTMGLARDESNWYLLRRLNEEALEFLKQYI